MECTITGIAQEMNLESNTTLTYLVLRLPDGRAFNATVSDEAVAAIVGAHLERSGPPQVAAQAPMRSAPQTPPLPVTAPSPIPVEQEQVHIFGGDSFVDTAEEADPVAPSPAPLPASAPARSAVQYLPNGKMVVPQRTVPRNEYGYPVVPNAGFDVDALTGNRDPDEDGIGSV